MKVVIVGSGASGVHFAQSALRKGHQVTMLDVGKEGVAPPNPDSDIHQLKDRLENPLDYFLGEDLVGFVAPGSRSTFYGFPPSREHVFNRPERLSVQASGMEPYFTFARGGFAEAWTAGVYPFNSDELQPFPFDYEDIRPAYAEVVRRIGVGARPDDLEKFIPYDADYLPPLDADPHSNHLLESYARRRDRLNGNGWFMGRSRVATLSRDREDRHACDSLGRCFWGCPLGSLYTPAATLRRCQEEPAFEYHPGLFVTHFTHGSNGELHSLHADTLEGTASQKFTGDLYVLAAGALMTSKIVLDSIFRATGEVVELEGLMDNRQIHVPFLTPAMIGRPVESAAYQYHHLAFGLESSPARHYVHGQITTLKAASIHPIVQNLPVDVRTAIKLFRTLRPGLGVANINLHDTRRPESRLTIRPLDDGGRSQLVIDYVPADDEEERSQRALKRVKRSLRTLRAFPPPGLTRVLPKGTSVHYAGTLPMSGRSGSLRTKPDGTMDHFPNLCIADGATFPFLPAKNHTLTLMANAVRMAELLL